VIDDNVIDDTVIDDTVIDNTVIHHIVIEGRARPRSSPLLFSWHFFSWALFLAWPSLPQSSIRAIAAGATHAIPA
jgi:hypothetical protein